MSADDEEFLDLSPDAILDLAEELTSLPWPEETVTTTRDGVDISSGPDFHLTVLVATDFFNDDQYGSQARAAMERVGGRIEALEKSARERWGDPRTHTARTGPDKGIIDQMMVSLGFSEADVWDHNDDAIIVLFGGHPMPRVPIHQVLMVCPPHAIPISLGELSD